MSDNLERRVWLPGEEAAWLADKIVAYDDYCKDAARFLLMLSEVQQQLAAITAERDALKARIEEAEKQDGVSWLSILNSVYDCKLTLKRYSLGCPFAETIQSIEQKKAHGQLGHPNFGYYPDLPKLYAAPIPSPETAELIRKAREEEQESAYILQSEMECRLFYVCHCLETNEQIDYDKVKGWRKDYNASIRANKDQT